MTNAETQALIEEARRARIYETIHALTCPGIAQHPAAVCSLWAAPTAARIRDLLDGLADALEASEAARRDLTDKIEALAKRLDIPEHRYIVGLLRGLVSGDKERTDG